MGPNRLTTWPCVVPSRTSSASLDAERERVGAPLGGLEQGGVDIAVIGGGPAGATAGRLLAEWGHSVAILDRQPARQSLAESLPPSTRKILEHVGLLERVDRAGFLPATGNTAWWGEPAGRSESFAGAPGYQVLRRDFDRLLLDAARVSGARLRAGVSVGRVDLEERGDEIGVEYVKRNGATARLRARFVLDCSGRAGVIARRFRVKDKRLTTIALSGVWRSPDGFAGVDATHTLVESYADGWAWSVPLSKELRHVAVMVDPSARAGKAGGSASRYRAELSKTTHFDLLTSNATLGDAPWACDASVYGSRAFGGPRFLLVGDAASFLDPMSSFGVKKALTSAWMAAVVANTCLRRPERAASALDLFSRREREMAATYERESFRYVREAAARHSSAFWKRRAVSVSLGDAPEDAGVRAAFEGLKRKRRFRLRPGSGVSHSQVPEIQGSEVVLASAVASPALPEGVRHVRGVLVPALLQVASENQRRDVPGLHQAYSRVGPAVALPDFIAVLSYLLANGILERVER